MFSKEEIEHLKKSIQESNSKEELEELDKVISDILKRVEVPPKPILKREPSFPPPMVPFPPTPNPSQIDRLQRLKDLVEQMNELLA